MGNINLNAVLRTVGNTSDIDVDGAINLNGTKGLSLSRGTAVAAGTTSGTAAVTSYHHTTLFSVAASNGVRFDAFSAGQFKTIKNFGAQALTIYPPTGGRIDSKAADASVTLASGLGALFYALDDNDIAMIKGS